MKQKNFKSYGVITPISWDKNNRPLKFSLYTPQGEDLLIHKEYRGHKLNQYLGEQVIVTGTLTEEIKDYKTILPKKITRVSFGAGGGDQLVADHDPPYAISFPRSCELQSVNDFGPGQQLVV